MKLESSPNLIKTFVKFRDTLYNPRSVLYPSCGFDESPGKVFPNVTFVDLERETRGCIDALKRAGYKAFSSDIRGYKPSEEHDLLILQNPAAPANWSTSHLQTEGYVIANNYHGTARELFESSKFALIAGIDCGDNGVEVMTNLEGFFERVKDLEEFKRCRPDAYEFEEGIMQNFASQGLLSCPSDAPVEEKWRLYIEDMWHGKMPAKRTADQYVFRKIK